MRGADNAHVTGISMKNELRTHVTTSGAESRGDCPGQIPGRFQYGGLRKTHDKRRGLAIRGGLDIVQL